MPPTTSHEASPPDKYSTAFTPQHPWTHQTAQSAPHSSHGSHDCSSCFSQASDDNPPLSSELQEGWRGKTPRRRLLVPVQVLRREMLVRHQPQRTPEVGVSKRFTWGPPEWAGFNWRIERQLWERWYSELALAYVGSVMSRATQVARSARAAAARAAASAHAQSLRVRDRR